MQPNDHFFMSCRDSRIESPRSFYGSFYLGPFKASQSLTIANALRRTLLSELSGIGITSIYIEGADHDYATLNGVYESVLDILLNLKEIVFKSNKPLTKSLVGYLQVSGPGVVRSADLRLPAPIQIVDPNQHIATLSADGHLNLKFIISEGQNFLVQTPNEIRQSTKEEFEHFTNKVPLCIDPVFMPVTKVNYIIESDQLYAQSNDAGVTMHDGDSGENTFLRSSGDSSSQKLFNKHVIILEIWTNGSIYPREALSESIKNLLLLFSSLNDMVLINEQAFIKQNNAFFESDHEEFTKFDHLISQIQQQHDV